MILLPSIFTIANTKLIQIELDDGVGWNIVEKKISEGRKERQEPKNISKNTLHTEKIECIGNA
jgi:hypothetical protein